MKFKNFEIQILQMTSDGKSTKTKVVDLNENYNFVVDDFFIWNDLMSQQYGWSFDDLKFQFVKTTNIKVVDLDQNNNFVVDDFFIWCRLGF